MSRPKKEVTRSKEYRIRLLPEEYETLKDLAKRKNTTMANLIRRSICERADSDNGKEM